MTDEELQDLSREILEADIEKQRAMLDSASMWNKSLEANEKAFNARAAAAAYQAQADDYAKQQTAANARAGYWGNEQSKAEQNLRDIVGVSDADVNMQRSQARMAQAEQEKANTDAELARASKDRETYTRSYEENMKKAEDAERRAKEMDIAGVKATTAIDGDAARKFSDQAVEARNEAERYRAEAANAEKMATSFAKREAELKETSDKYAAQISAEKDNQASITATKGVKQAEYAVLTGSADETQKKLYEQSKQYDEDQKFSKQAEAWAKKVPTAGQIVHGAGDVISQGAGKVIEGAEGTGVVRTVRNINGVVGTTRTLFGW